MLIGIHGLAGAGKDTIAAYLVDWYQFTKYSLADPLKRLVMDLLDLSHEQCYGGLKEVADRRYGVSPRWLLQYVGTDVFRRIRDDVWVSQMGKFYQQMMSSRGGHGARMVVPDVRFRNEYGAIRELGGYMWRVERIGHEGAGGDLKKHSSETELAHLGDDDFDVVLRADSGDIRGLHAQANEAFHTCSEREKTQ